MSGVFISYRRDDCAGHAGRLYDRLVERFGEERVFMDIDSIEPGADFGERLEEAVGACGLLIALIGDDWLAVKDARGRRRLDDPSDFVRLELAAGLTRSDLRVIPVLVEDASMPSTDDLPDDLKLLARRNAFELSDARWRYDVQRLLEVVEPAVRGERRRARPADAGRRGRSLPNLPRPTPTVLRAAGAVVLLALVAAGIALLGGEDGDKRSSRQAVIGPIRVGTDAGRPAVTAGAVWVPVGSKSAVARVDPQTRQVKFIEGLGDFPSSATAGAGGIWVADSGDDTVTRIDPRTNEVDEPIDVGDEPNDIAVGEGYVWTANCACSTEGRKRFTVSRIDPRTREVKEIEVDPYPLAIAIGDGNVWVTSDGEGTVQRVDPRAGEVVGEAIPVGDSPAGVVVDRTGIWVALQSESGIARVDPRALRAGDRVGAGPEPHTLSIGGGFLWVADNADGTVRRIDLERRRPFGPPISAGAGENAVTFGDGRVWLVNRSAGELRGFAP